MTKRRKFVVAAWLLVASVVAYVAAHALTLGCIIHLDQALRLTKSEQSGEFIPGLSVDREHWPRFHNYSTSRVLPYLLTLVRDEFPINVNVGLLYRGHERTAEPFSSFTVLSLVVSVDGQNQILVGPQSERAERTFQIKDGTEWCNLKEQFAVNHTGSTVDVLLEGEAVKRDGNVVPYRVAQQYIMAQQARFTTGWGQLGSL